MGDDLLPANPMNSPGFYQDVAFESLFDGCPEWMPAYPGNELCDIAALDLLIQQRCQSHAVWGLKIRLGAFIAGRISQACSLKVIALDRPRSSSVQSLAEWFEPGEQDPEIVIDRASHAVQQAIDGRDSITVQYESLIADPALMVGRIARFVGKDVTQQAMDSVSPALRRY